MANQNYELAIQHAKPKFNEIARTLANPVNWDAESNYAMQVLKKNKALAACPIDTIKDSMVNVAAIGLSLNPAQKLAYLVPRDGVACLDISYQGLMKLATDTGLVEWCKAVLVREGDDFVWIDFETRPEHKDTEPFNTKRAVIGGYVITQLRSGKVMCEKMSRDELDQVKNTSKAKNGPWKTWPEEMMKKTLIKRASKSWPKTDGSERFHEAVHMVNDIEGNGEIDVTNEVVELISDNQIEIISAKLIELKMRPMKVCAAFEIDALRDMPANRYDECMERLNAASGTAPPAEPETTKEPIEGELVDETVVKREFSDDEKNEIHDALCQLWGMGPYKESGGDASILDPLEACWGMGIGDLAEVAGITREQIKE